MSRITIKELSYSYHSRGGVTQALNRVSLSLAEGEVIGLTGVSGSGKSTLLNILSGILHGYSGEVLINGEPPNPKKHSIALVPQSYGLLPWKRVRENILLPHTLGKKCERIGELQSIVDRLEIGALLHRYPSELSGGQKQRVALARAFVQSPDLLLMDEPFSALDISTATRSKELFKAFQKELGVTTVMVSHNPQEIEGLTDRVIILGGSPGEVIADTHLPKAEQILQEILRNEE